MRTTKIMKGFNVEKYNDEINKLNMIIKTVDDFTYLFVAWGDETKMSKEWFESLLNLPFAEIRKHLNSIYMANDLQYPYSIDFECDTTILSCYIDYLGEIDRTMKRQIEFLKILPEIQKAYGSLFIYNNKHCEMTKDAERLIMEQCIEWEED